MAKQLISEMTMAETAAAVKAARGTDWHVQTVLGTGMFIGDYLDAQKFAAVSDMRIMWVDDSTQTIILD